MAKFTKKAILLGFLEILKSKPLDKITVKDICEFCEINRNTFYYYFENIYDTLAALFEMEADKVLKESDKETATFQEEYARSTAIVLNNRQAILHIYRSKDGTVLRSYLELVVKDFVRRFVKKAADSHSVTDKDIESITDFYSYAIVGNTMHWIENGFTSNRDNFIKRISASFEYTIQDMLKAAESN